MYARLSLVHFLDSFYIDSYVNDLLQAAAKMLSKPEIKFYLICNELN
jgi:hypothetical protein